MYSVPPPLHSAHGLGNHYVAHRPIQYPQLPTLLPPPPALSRGQYTHPEGLFDMNTDLNNITSFIMPRRHRTSFLEDISGCSAQITPGPLPVLQPPGPKVRPAKNPSAAAQRTQIAHPYARLFAKKDEVKRRKIWNHALEKSIFDPTQLSSIGAPQRRKIYTASLEAHIDRLHAQLLDLGWWPVAFETLDPFKGLNSKTAKSMVSGLQHDASVSKLKLLEMERANGDLQKIVLSGIGG